MKVQPLFLVCLGAILVASACSTPAPPKQTARSVTEYHTFSIASLPIQGPSSDPAAPARLREVGHATILQSLTDKGYHEVDPSEADFIVEVETEFSPDPFIEGFEKRTFTISLRERQSNAVLWTNQRARSSSRAMEPDILRRTIMEMFVSLPPAHVPLAR